MSRDRGSAWHWQAHCNSVGRNDGRCNDLKSGREFASFLGLVHRQKGTSGKVRLGSISKRGDP
jgi:transposase